MIMRKLTRLFAKQDENYKFQRFIQKVKKNEELKAEEYANRSRYVNPREYLSGKLIKAEEMLACLQGTDYCPV